MSVPPSKSHGRKSTTASLKPRDLMDQNPRLAGVWTAQIITLFPNAFPGVLGESLTGRALKDRKWALETIDLRRFGDGKHRNVDDTPAGGGAGMVLRADVVGNAIDHAIAPATDLFGSSQPDGSHNQGQHGRETESENNGRRQWHPPARAPGTQPPGPGTCTPR